MENTDGYVRRSRIRFAVMVAVGLGAAAWMGTAGSWLQAPAVGWAASSLVYTLWVWLLISPMDAAQTAAHATAEDPSRGTTDLLILLANVASLAGIVVVLADSASGSRSQRALLAVLAIVGVALSWLLVHTLFTLRYARLYYANVPGGIDFNQDEPPRYTDFAYLAFSLGMTFQVSDTNLQNHVIRATALRHGLLAYLFGTVILATTINLVVGLAQ